MMMLKEIFILLASYLLGSILIGDIVAGIKKIDLRGQGSGNVGATNVFRTMGPLYGSIVLAGDACKGILAVWLGSLLPRVYGLDQGIITGLLAIAGHNWSAFARFRGGKGIATSLGVTVAIAPFTLILVIPLWLIVFFGFGYVSLASIIVAFCYPIMVYLTYPNDKYRIGFAVILAVFAIYKHRSNIGRLRRGEEHQILYNKKGVKPE